MHLSIQHPTASTVRESFFEDPSSPSDPELLVLLLPQGSRVPGPGRKPRKNYTAFELAHGLLDDAGGRLTRLVTSIHENTLDLKRYGLGPTLGSRLITAMELAHRYRRKLSGGGNPKIRPGGEKLVKAVVERQLRPTEGELVSILLGDLTEARIVTQLLEAYSSPALLIASLAPSDFEPAYEDPSRDYRHSVSGVELLSAATYRLLAAAEIARRHRKRKANDRHRLKAQALGFTSPDLLQLLDPRSPLESELRRTLLEALRSHPARARDFAVLERLAEEARTKDYERAIELQEMFEVLLKRRRWSHPAEILGDPVPYPALLSIARARIEANAKPPGRIRRIQKILEDAERGRTKDPITAFVETLLELDLSESAADKAFAEAHRQYLDGQRRRQGARAARRL